MHSLEPVPEAVRGRLGAVAIDADSVWKSPFPHEKPVVRNHGTKAK